MAQNGALLIGLLFGYLCYMPTLALTNNIASTAWRTSIKPFRWCASSHRLDYRRYLHRRHRYLRYHRHFTLAALCSAALAVYSLTLPHTPAPAKGTPVRFAICCAPTLSRC